MGALVTRSLLSTARAAIFDLDGTLLDTEPLYTRATQTIAERYGKRFDWELKRRTMGGDAEFGARLITQALDLPLTPQEYLTERVALLKQLFVSVPAMPGAEAWVNALLQAKMPVAIGTSSFAELCAIKWSVHAWVEAIAVKVCGDDPQVRARKPAPDIFVVAAERLGVAPQECVVFEDSPAGVQAARQAGMRVVAIRAPQLDARHLEGADLIVDGYHQLDMDLFAAAKRA